MEAGGLGGHVLNGGGAVASSGPTWVWGGLAETAREGREIFLAEGRMGRR